MNLFVQRRHIKAALLTGAAMLMASLFVLSSPLAAEAASATILRAWSDAGGRSVFVRSGTYNGSVGFGMAKVQQRHKINSIASLVFVTKNPNGGVKEGDDRRYNAYANKKICSDGTCTYTESVPVRAIMSNIYASTYYGVLIKGAIGIKTAYCTTDAALLDCPSWVDQALAGVASRTAGEQSETAWSYQPVAIGKVVGQ